MEKVAPSYFKALAGYPLLDAASEREISESLREARRGLWRVILSDPVAARAALKTLPPQVRRQVRGRGVIRRSVQLATIAPDYATVLAASRAAESASSEPDYGARLQRARRPVKRLRERLVHCNLRLVVKLARIYESPLSLAERIQEGSAGLLTAADRFDPDRGVRFATYAVWWIRHAILRSAQDRGRLIRLPANVSAAGFKIRRARTALGARQGQAPENVAESAVAAEVGITVEKVRHVERSMRRSRPVALDDADEDAPLADRLPDEEAAEAIESVEAGCDIGRLREALDGLPRRDREIVRRIFGLGGGEPRNAAQVARELGLSRERVRQIRARALEKLRKKLEDPPGRGVAALR